MKKSNISMLKHMMNNDPTVTADQYEAVLETLQGKRSSVKSPYYTLLEVAALFRWSKEHVCRKTAEGKIPFIKNDGGHRMYLREEVDQLLKTGI